MRIGHALLGQLLNLIQWFVEKQECCTQRSWMRCWETCTHQCTSLQVSVHCCSWLPYFQQQLQKRFLKMKTWGLTISSPLSSGGHSQANRRTQQLPWAATGQRGMVPITPKSHMDMEQGDRLDFTVSGHTMFLLSSLKKQAEKSKFVDFLLR